MFLSQTAIYALKAALCLAEADPDLPMRVEDIAQRLDVPRNYLSKILHVLAKGGALTSTRGPKGGFRLARSAADVKLSEIVRHFDELSEESGCLLGRAKCSDTNPCLAHHRWKDVSLVVHDFFQGTALADLLDGSSSTKFE